MAPPKLTSVKVSPKAQAVIALHATRHRYTSVGGFLLGTTSNNITDAIPVAHGTLTQTILDTAQSLLDEETSNSIVGWYTAPRLLKDTRPDAVTLRVVAQMASESLEPVLLFVNNEKLSEFMNGNDVMFLQALGRDFGSQWLEEIDTKSAGQTNKNLGSSLGSDNPSATVNDLLDHFEDIQSPWFPNKPMDKFIGVHL